MGLRRVSEQERGVHSSIQGAPSKKIVQQIKAYSEKVLVRCFAPLTKQAAVVVV